MRHLFAFLVLLASANAQVIFQTVAGSSQAQVATPTYNNDTNSYAGSVTVTIDDATSGAAGKYCTAVGSDCDPSGGTTIVSFPVSPAAITVNGTHLCSYATKAGMTQSATKCATYTITASAPAFVDAATWQGTLDTSAHTTGTMNVAPGDTLIVAVNYGAGSSCNGTFTVTSSCFTGNLTNIGTDYASSTYNCISLWRGINTNSGASCTVTVTPTGSVGAGTIIAAHASGVTAVDVTANQTGSSTTNPVTTAAYTTNASYPNQLILVFAEDYNVDNYYASGTIDGSTAVTIPAAGKVKGGSAGDTSAAVGYKAVSAQVSSAQATMSKSGTINGNIRVVTLR